MPPSSTIITLIRGAHLEGEVIEGDLHEHVTLDVIDREVRHCLGSLQWQIFCDLDFRSSKYPPIYRQFSLAPSIQLRGQGLCGSRDRVDFRLVDVIWVVKYRIPSHIPVGTA